MPPFTIQQVRSLAPGLPDELAQLLLDLWIESGDFLLALEQMRSDPRYDEFFPGNRRADGSLRHDEATYLAVVESFDRTLLSAGVNPALFRQHYEAMIAGGTSPLEFDDRVETLKQRVLVRSQELRESYAALEGIELSDEALIASVLDPNLNRALVERRITTAEVGAEASLRGLAVDVADVRRIVDFDITPARAAQIFAQAQDAVPLIDTLARRHLDPDDTFDMSEFLRAFAFDDPLQRRRIDRLLRAEAAAFTAQGGVIARTDEQIVGLQTR